MLEHQLNQTLMVGFFEQFLLMLFSNEYFFPGLFSIIFTVILSE